MAHQAGLVDVLGSAAAGLGVRGFTDTLGFGDVQHAVICLVDGLGWRLLQEHGEHAPTLISAPGRSIDSVFPTTTPSALGSMGTGLLPGAHGLVGASFFLPETEQVLSPLHWDAATSPIAVQPEPTIFEVVARQGVVVSSIGPVAYGESGLTRAVLRGAQYRPAEDIPQRVRALQSATSGTGRTLTYVYWAEVDRVGHASGVGSKAWHEAVRRADGLVAGLQSVLPRDSAMLVTADHGMVNCPPSSRIAIESHPDLVADVLTIAGEPRVRHVYARPMHVGDVAARWAARLGGHARVFTRDEIVAEGLYGPTEEALAERIGDVVAVAQGSTSLTSRRDTRVSSLIGQHGALTAAEWEIPAVMFRGEAPG
jgi:hypothetical protein